MLTSPRSSTCTGIEPEAPELSLGEKPAVVGGGVDNNFTSGSTPGGLLDEEYAVAMSCEADLWDYWAFGGGQPAAPLTIPNVSPTHMKPCCRGIY